MIERIKNSKVIYIIISTSISLLLMDVGIILMLYMMLKNGVVDDGAIKWFKIMLLSWNILILIPEVELSRQGYKVKKSKKLTNEFLSKTEYTIIEPIKLRYYEKFILSLTDIADFYAILSDKKNSEVLIFIKLKNEEKMRFFTTESNERFAEFFKIP